MTKLRMAEDLSLPVDAATQTFAFIARKGGGKTYAAGKLAEELLDAGVQVLVLDTVGNWFGLRLSADGRGAGFDVPVLGGLRGDIPLEATGGALIADIAVDTGRSMVLDCSQFSLADRRRFATTFGERIWQRKKGERHPSPLHLVIEESQLIVPQMVKGDVAKMVGIYEEIIRLGRNYGIGVSMITQRPQSVNKEVLNQTECLFVGQVNGAQERDALQKWIVHQGMDKNLVSELPSLPVGTFYVWSPQWLQILQKVRILPKRTLDASSTPKVGETRARRELKPLDLDDLKTKMAETIERAKADDPKELRKQIADLKRDLAKAATEPAPKPAAESREVRTEWKERMAEMEKTARADRARFDRLRRLFGKVTATIADLATELGAELPAIPEMPREIAPVALPRRVEMPVRTRAASAVTGSGPGGGSLGKGERAILAVLSQYPHGKNRRALGTLSGYTASGGSFGTYISRLRGKGCIDGSDPIRITDEGLTALGAFEPLPRGEELQSYWLARLGKGEAAILRVLIDRYPDVLSRDELGQLSGYEASGGSFGTYLSRLRTKELIDERELRASEAFFE